MSCVCSGIVQYKNEVNLAWRANERKIEILKTDFLKILIQCSVACWSLCGVLVFWFF